MSDQWFYGQNGTQRGPVEVDALRALANSGQLLPGDLLWREGMAEWTAASAVMPDLFAAASAPSAPWPPSPIVPPVAPVPPPTVAAPSVVPALPTVSPVGSPLAYEPPPYNADTQNARAVWSLVLGILSLPTCLCPFVGIGLGVGAIVLGAGVRGGPNKGIAVAGLVCGIVGTVCSLPQTANVLFHL